MKLIIEFDMEVYSSPGMLDSMHRVVTDVIEGLARSGINPNCLGYGESPMPYIYRVEEK